MIHTLSSGDDSIFHWNSANFAISRNTGIDCIYKYIIIYTQFLILLTYFESLKIVLISMVLILMMSAKMVTLGLLKIKVMMS